jgi:hypothetical protein
VIDWLNSNAGAIQALASIAALAVAAILARLTARYVHLTKQLADSSLEQVKHIREIAESARVRDAAALRALSIRLRVPLSELSHTPSFDELRRFDYIDAGDVADLESLARSVGGDALFHATRAILSLRALLGMVAKVKAINEGTGWLPRENDTSLYRSAVQSAVSELAKVEAKTKELPPASTSLQQMPQTR